MIFLETFFEQKIEMVKIGLLIPFIYMVHIPYFLFAGTFGVMGLTAEI